MNNSQIAVKTSSTRPGPGIASPIAEMRRACDTQRARAADSAPPSSAASRLAFDAAGVGMALTDLDGPLPARQPRLLRPAGLHARDAHRRHGAGRHHPPRRRVARPRRPPAAIDGGRRRLPRREALSSTPTASRLGGRQRHRHPRRATARRSTCSAWSRRPRSPSASRPTWPACALHDPLTGLANRTLLDDRLRAALARAGRHGVAHRRAVPGPRRLQGDQRPTATTSATSCCAVARRLRAVLRPADVVARLGGDEFVAVCEELAGLEEAHAIASRVEVAIAAPIDTERRAADRPRERRPGAGRGRPDADADDLIRRADEAMYRAKQAGTSGLTPRFPGRSRPVPLLAFRATRRSELDGRIAANRRRPKGTYG